MKKLHLIALNACVLALAACNTVDGLVEDIKFNDWFPNSGASASKSENLLASDCPSASVVPELGAYAEFTDNGKPSTKTLQSYAKISNVESKCQYGPQSVTVDIKLSFEGALGQAGRTGGKPYFSYPFFVAVTSPTNAILAKEVFSANMTYDQGDQQTYFETMRQIIPIPSKDVGKNFKILAGFQLTDDQLAYNRAVIASEEAAAKERARIQQENIEAAKKAAKDNDKPAPEVVVVPDTMTPADSGPPPAAEPIQIAPLKN